jgi:hypothetical protein
VLHGDEAVILGLDVGAGVDHLPPESRSRFGGFSDDFAPRW